jgi:hypothetical protein
MVAKNYELGTKNENSLTNDLSLILFKNKVTFNEVKSSLKKEMLDE